MNSSLALSLKGLSKSFGDVIANENVSLDLYQGEVLALLGENGAGKSTLMNLLFGHYTPDSGRVEIAAGDGSMHPLPLGQPQAAIAAGIGMVHQHFTLAENLTALDNIMLGSESLARLWRKRGAGLRKVESIMSRSGLSVPLDVPVGKLTVGERQRVEILKALYRDVNILVLDEPTAVLTPQEADNLFENIRNMTSDGLSVIFISHKMREVLAFSQRIVVLRLGKNVGEIATDKADEQVIANMMVGVDTQAVVRSHQQSDSQPNHQQQDQQPGNPVLQLKSVSVPGLSRRSSLESANLVVHEHEIVGIAGISGNGQVALSGVISGVVKPVAGEIMIAGATAKKHQPQDRIASGVACIPEDRHRDGIVGEMNLAENMIIERLNDKDFQSLGFLNRNAIKAMADELIQSFDIRGPGVSAPTKLLSGGNIQKLILARVFERAPKIILANQPTRGLDMGAAAEVERRLLAARADGAGIVLISEDLDEVVNLSDRIIVMHDGQLIQTDSRDRAAIGLLMAGKAA